MYVKKAMKKRPWFIDRRRLSEIPTWEVLMDLCILIITIILFIL